eukprot:snap_masked-scaffold_4-processed-gene-12.13-mRNA-1 protein AED:0.20 eAED:0.21 QI:0/-1/0/1/-1/1/1/0/629
MSNEREYVEFDIEKNLKPRKKRSRKYKQYEETGSCCKFFKNFLIFTAIVSVTINLYEMKQIALQFEKDALELKEVADIIEDVEAQHRQFKDVLSSHKMQAASFTENKVIDILKVLESTEREIRPKSSTGLSDIVILGKSFILNRDAPLWEQTFSKVGLVAQKTTKQDLNNFGQSTWIGLKCLDLFDGKSHCIEPNDLPRLQKYQKVSRLYGLRKTLWNKDRFCDTITSSLEGFNQTGFIPFTFQCWLLPSMYKGLMTYAKQEIKKEKLAGSKDKLQFIAKPTDRGEGNGINVIDSLPQLARWKELYPENDEIIVQTYLPNPLLINQRKWDLRTYVLVTSIHPLRVYMYKDGLARFAASAYDKSASNGGKKTSFLTNTSVNKKAGIDVEDLTWPFPKLYKHISQLGLDAELLFKRIERAIVMTLLSAEPVFSKGFSKLENGYTCQNCYQLLGVDVIVDDNLVPRVIEVNGEPSMQLSGEKDSQYDITKTSMAKDLANLVYSKDSFAKAVTKDLSLLELAGHRVGYKQQNNCGASGFCLRKRDIEYLLDMKKEEENQGGFRRIYPSRDEEDLYGDYVQHLESKMPYGAQGSTAKIHKLAREVSKLSNFKTDNEILDPAYFKRMGEDPEFDD